jgi:hypothetical protein
MGQKGPALPHRLYNVVQEGCLLCSPHLLNENVCYAKIIIKSILKMTFLLKTLETKKVF